MDRGRVEGEVSRFQVTVHDHRFLSAQMRGRKVTAEVSTGGGGGEERSGAMRANIRGEEE
eukprot:758395-Hanusia_phi.AAC.1